MAGSNQDLGKLFKHDARFLRKEPGQVFPCSQFSPGIRCPQRSPVQLGRNHYVVRAGWLHFDGRLRDYAERDKFIDSGLVRTIYSLRMLNVHNHLAHCCLWY